MGATMLWFFLLVPFSQTGVPSGGSTIELPTLPAGNTSVLVGKLIVTGDLNLEHWEAEATLRDEMRATLKHGCTQFNSELNKYAALTAVCNVCFDSPLPHGTDGSFKLHFVARVRSLVSTSLPAWIAPPTSAAVPVAGGAQQGGGPSLMTMDLNQRIQKRADEFETLTVTELRATYVTVTGTVHLLALDASAADHHVVVPGYALHGYVSDGGDDDTTERRLAAMCLLDADLTDGSRDQSLRLLHTALGFAIGASAIVFGVALVRAFGKAATEVAVAPRHVSAWDVLWKRDKEGQRQVAE